MSDIRTARAELTKLADDLKSIGKKSTAGRIMTIVETHMMRAHVGVPQGPKKVKRASAKKAPAKKAPAKKPVAKKAPAKKKAPVKKAMPNGAATGTETQASV